MAQGNISFEGWYSFTRYKHLELEMLMLFALFVQTSWVAQLHTGNGPRATIARSVSLAPFLQLSNAPARDTDEDSVQTGLGTSPNMHRTHPPYRLPLLPQQAMGSYACRRIRGNDL
jgi:hypothetical protein